MVFQERLTSTETSLEDRDLLITAVEINAHHGVGVLLQRFFPDSKSFTCIRSFSVYDGNATFGCGEDLVLDRPRHRDDVRAEIANHLSKCKIRRILCVPYYTADFVHAVVAKEITGAPLVTYIMDDQNAFSPEVEDAAVDHLLRVSDLRLGISWELCAAYERKFKQKFELLPPVLTARAPFVCNYWQLPKFGERIRAAMIGNVWTAGRFRRLRASLKRASLQIDWYGNGQDANWLEGTIEEWERDGIRCLGHLPEHDLVAALASYPYILVPSGSCDEFDDNPSFSRLSLPSRILFLHASTDTPLLVLGSDLGAAGHFVQTQGTGICCAADDQLVQVHSEFTDPVRRAAYRKNIQALAPHLVLPDAGGWIWRSLEQGSSVAAPFNRVFQPPSLERVNSITKALPKEGGKTQRLRAAMRLLEAEAYSRQSHFRAVKDAGLLPPSWEIETAELTTVMRSYAAWRVAGLVSRGDNLLFLGDEIPDATLALFSGVRIWGISNLPELWSGRQTAIHYVCLGGGGSHPRPPTKFKIVWSTGLANHIPDDWTSCEKIAAFCDNVCATGGSNLHFFTAISNPTYNWVHPLHGAFTRRSGQQKTWPTFADLFMSEDAFFMSSSAYASYWQPSTGRSAQEFGRCCWLGICWRGPSFLAKNRRRFWASSLGQRVIAWQQKFRS